MALHPAVQLSTCVLRYREIPVYAVTRIAEKYAKRMFLRTSETHVNCQTALKKWFKPELCELRVRCPPDVEILTQLPELEADDLQLCPQAQNCFSQLANKHCHPEAAPIAA